MFVLFYFYFSLIAFVQAALLWSLDNTLSFRNCRIEPKLNGMLSPEVTTSTAGHRSGASTVAGSVKCRSHINCAALVETLVVCYQRASTSKLEPISVRYSLN